MALRKPAGTWTYDDLLTLPDDGRRYEIIEGELYEMPAPGWDHAITVMNLILLLAPLVQRLGGTLVTAPVDVFFAGANPVQPDILALLPGSPASGEGRGVTGPPDLIVEVLSPSNRMHDEVTKRALYARAGVREYWIVDPDQRTLQVLSLDGNAVHADSIGSGNDRLASPLLGPLNIAVDDLFPAITE
jgi:Uma2 family endonuclease